MPYFSGERLLKFLPDYCNGHLGVLDLLVQSGVCTWATMPYSDNNGCTTQPSQNQVSSAADNRLSRYERIVDLSNTGYFKSLLAQGFPILIGAYVDDDFQQAGPGFYWDEPPSGSYGFHAMVIIGYNDADSAFIIMNSWGQDWGDEGETQLAYNNLTNVVAEAFITFPASNNNNNNNNNNNLCSSGQTGTIVVVNTEFFTHYVTLDIMPTGLEFLAVSGYQTESMQGVCSGLRTWYAYETKSEAIQGNTSDSRDQGNINLQPNSIDTIYVNY